MRELISARKTAAPTRYMDTMPGTKVVVTSTKFGLESFLEKLNELFGAKDLEIATGKTGFADKRKYEKCTFIIEAYQNLRLRTGVYDTNNKVHVIRKGESIDLTRLENQYKVYIPVGIVSDITEIVIEIIYGNSYFKYLLTYDSELYCELWKSGDTYILVRNPDDMVEDSDYVTIKIVEK